MCTKTKSAVAIINESLRVGRVFVPRTELERVRLIRTAMAVYANTGRKDLITAARMLADASHSPPLWHKIIDRDLHGESYFPDAKPAELVGAKRTAKLGRFAHLFLWPAVTATVLMIVIACHG